MSALETKTEPQSEEFTHELSDEALDRGVDYTGTWTNPRDRSAVASSAPSL
jgi:hypothetical protein